MIFLIFKFAPFVFLLKWKPDANVHSYLYDVLFKKEQKVP